MKTMKILIIATALATTLGPVSVYAMDQGQGQSRLANVFQEFTAEQVAQANRELMAAVEADNVVGVTQALDHGAHMNNQLAQGGNRPLIEACMRGRTEIVALLLDRGADADINQVFPNGYTPLIIACRHRRTEIVALLLSRGADINQPNRFGYTPLMMACIDGRTEIVELLLSCGADINLPNQLGATPLFIACFFGHTGIVKKLVFNGATLSGRETAEMQPVIEQAREARGQVGDYCLNVSDFTRLSFRTPLPKEVVGHVYRFANPLVGVQDPELRELIQKQILKNRKERCAQASVAAQEGAAAEQENKAEVKDEEVKDGNAVQPIAHAVAHDQQDDDAPRRSVYNRSTCIVL